MRFQRLGAATLAVATMVFAAPAAANAMVGGVAHAGAAHASVGHLVGDDGTVCTAALVGPGWAITAAHCLQDAPHALRMLTGRPGRLALGRIHRVPDGGDLALIEVPEAAELRLPWLAPPNAPVGTCPDEPWPITVVGTRHVPDGRITRTPAQAPLLTYGECSTDGHLPMIIAPQTAPTAVCQGDSGNPVVEAGADATSIRAVLVAKVATDGVGACGRSVFAIGFTEPLATGERIAWLARTAHAPRAPRAFAATVRRGPGNRIHIRPRAWQAGPPPGTRVALVGRRGHTVARGIVGPTGTLRLRAPGPGTYRLRSRTAAGSVRWSVPLRLPVGGPGPRAVAAR